MGRPPFTTIVDALGDQSVFIGPETIERNMGAPLRARLGANENAFGPAPAAISAMAAAVPEIWKYGDPDNHDLRTALARHCEVAVDNVIVGEGIDGLLGLTCMLFLSPGDTAVTTDGAYATFNFHVEVHGGRVIKIPMRDGREDIQDLMAAASRHSAKIVYISNPNNPLGSWWDGSVIEDLVAQLPPGVLLVLDEAYLETAPLSAVARLNVDHPQVMRYRTFSKAYGLAGARIGYAIGHRDTVAAFDKVRNQYGTNRIGQIGALAALADQQYLASVCDKIAASRVRIGDIATANGLRPLPSAANFVAIDCLGDAAFATRVLHALAARNVFIRKPWVPPIDRCIRVSAGAHSDVDVLEQELPRALAASRKAA